MKSKNDNFKNSMIGASSQELVTRYGSAGAEFLKGLRGIDYETGQVFDRSLQKISEYNLNPEYIDQNIQQQAGFSAEVAYVSKKNSESIINKTDSIFSRSEDIAKYGKNHNVVDIIEKTADGQEITSQMKFVSDPKKLINKIAKGEGGGKNDLSRYLEVDRLDLPSDQIEEAKKYCQEQIKKLNEKIEVLDKQGKTELAKKYKQQVKNFEKIEKKIHDSDITVEEAKQYRQNPKWETTKDIVNVSHRAGIEGAKMGAAIGGGISVVSNIVAVYSGDKEFSDAVLDAGKDTLTAAGVGYATAFTGSAIKSIMQQSSKEVMRNLSKTGLPAMIVSTCLATGKSIYKYAHGEIDEAQLLREMGSVGVNSLSTATFSMIGQLAIPVPVLGGLIGGMIGYTLTNNFYHSFLGVLDEVKISEERYQYISMQCMAAKIVAVQYQHYLFDIFENKLTQLNIETQNLFNLLDNPEISTDAFCDGVNKFAMMLGKDLMFKNSQEFEEFMLSDQPLTL